MGNSSPFLPPPDDILTTALPFIISSIILLAFITICCAICCGSSCCTACGCLCCGAAGRGKKKKKNVARSYGGAEPVININNRVRALDTQVMQGERTLTPVGGEEGGGDTVQEDTLTTDTNLEVSANKIDVKAAASDEENVVVITASEIEGVKNPKSVDEAAITKAALYHFQPKIS